MSWRDRIFFVVPIPGMLVLMVFGALVLFAPLLIPLLLLFLLGRAMFKWRPWFALCYTAVTVALLGLLLIWGVAWLQQRYDPLKLVEFRRVVLHEPASIIRRAGNLRQQRVPQVLSHYPVLR